jgi:hypothetical protein
LLAAREIARTKNGRGQRIMKTCTRNADHQLHPVFFSDCGDNGHPAISLGLMEGLLLAGIGFLGIDIRRLLYASGSIAIEDTVEEGVNLGAVDRSRSS